ncbi:MAG: serine/threonine-protein kinase, partial [Pirellulales bacterium]
PNADNALIREAPQLADHSVVAVLTPVLNQQGLVLAVLGVADTGTDDMFSKILETAQTGESGETYAFNKQGLMLTESRFNEQLKACGLIPDLPNARSSTVVELRDPGGDLTAGYRPTASRATRPLTHMARHATAGIDGIHLDGYRDYRGVQVIGAWRWLDEEDFGVAAEIDLREAYAPLRYLRVAFGMIFGLLIVAVAGVLVSSYRIRNLTRQVGEAQKLGQYTLEKKIGEGGMGEVYLARHAMLRRPTAIKLLKPDLVNPESVARFEREVQLASQLTHPNTIEIYDYGRTPDGVFYYVMEYLRGITLERLVAIQSPVSSARTVPILRQICQSLAEAHDVGLVHRDIKPLNIMLCRRGGQDDVVKVLDFGLVKQIDTGGDSQITQPRELSGTPLYIAPERLEDPTSLDTRSDIFSLGALTFKLLTGQDAFRGTSPLDLFYQLTNAPRPRPSARVDVPIPEPLDQLVVDSLAKDPADRPQTVVEILDLLNSLTETPHWTTADARDWWDARPELLGG